MLQQLALGEFHPVLVHLPIAFIFTVFFLDLCAWIMKRQSLLTIGHWFLLAAALLLIPTAITGFYAKEFYAPTDPDVLNHQNMAILTALFLIGYAALRTYCLTQGHFFSIYLYLALSLIAVSMIGTTAELGGIVVRGKGIFFQSKRGEGYPLLYDRVKKQTGDQK